MHRRSALRVAIVIGLLSWLSVYAAEAPEALSSGISRSRATELAEAFFSAEIVIEGALGEPSIQGKFWAFPVKLGYAGEVQPLPLLVDRNTGAASWAGLEAHRKKYGLARKEERQ